MYRCNKKVVCIIRMCIRYRMGRKPNNNHPVAAVRGYLKLSQKQFAELIDRSASTVQSIELGRLPLSLNLAARISDRTGVLMSWLMSGDVSKPIPAAESTGYRFVEYTKEHFDLCQSRKMKIADEEHIEMILKLLANDLTAVWRSATKNGAEASKRCVYQMENTLKNLVNKLQEEFGVDSDYQIASIEYLTNQLTGGVSKGPGLPDGFEVLSEE